MTRTLADAAVEAASCTKCRLAEGRTQVVFGVGNPHAELMFIGEAPGFNEDKQGEPFVGAAGQLLTRMLGEIGLTRADVYIANILKCLRYNALIQLGDGTWDRIGRLVNSKYDGHVMSVDSDGRLIPRRVIGWHRSPLGGRRVYRLTFRTAKNAGPDRVGIHLTGDHPVLTRRGYVPVEELRRDDQVATGQGLSDLAHDVVCGTLLGDGHLNVDSSYLSFSHSARQSAYAAFKAELLVELQPRTLEVSVAAVVGGEKIHPTVQVRTRAHRALRTLRADFYITEKRVPHWMSERLTPRMAAVWFMDDGHMRIMSGRQPLAEIATNGFPSQDLPILLAGLSRLGVEGTTARGRLYFNVAATLALSETIAPFVPPSMRHKLHPTIEARVPYDPGLFRVGTPLVQYDWVEREDITDRPRTDTTFFCIDVEETHNFVTAGGVVHNCRPPGNRDPLSDEIESCTPWLIEQLSLIQPCIVATLGNFATKFVLNTQTGITRLRGQTFPWHGRKVIPTFHPAAILHGGGEGSRQFEQLREDFATIKRELERCREPAPPVLDPTPDATDEEQLELF
jgi:uracil-DNA glycosylase family 4